AAEDEPTGERRPEGDQWFVLDLIGLLGRVVAPLVYLLTELICVCPIPGPPSVVPSPWKSPSRTSPYLGFHRTLAGSDDHRKGGDSCLPLLVPRMSSVDWAPCHVSC